MDVTPEHPDPEVSSASTGGTQKWSKRLRSENVGRGAFEQLEQLGVRRFFQRNPWEDLDHFRSLTSFFDGPNPAERGEPVEVGSLSYYLLGVLYIDRIFYGESTS